MCRMFYMETEQPLKSTRKIAKFALNWWSSRNKDGTGLALVNDGKVKILKTRFGAKAFWKNALVPRASRMAGHVRAGTAGGVTDANAHPFISCDGRSAFMHNGILGNWAALAAKMAAKGHKFTSQTDSEVMLHVLEEVGPERLMNRLKEEGISGYANWIWVTPEATFAYSDGALVLVRDEVGMKVAVFSDMEWCEKSFFQKPKEIPAGTLITIKNGKHSSKKGFPTLKVPVEWVYGGLVAGYMGGVEVKNTTCDKDDGIFDYADFNDEVLAAKAAMEAAWKKKEQKKKVALDDTAWIGPGDLFCKKCNVVYSEDTANGRCSICYGTLLNISNL